MAAALWRFVAHRQPKVEWASLSRVGDAFGAFSLCQLDVRQNPGGWLTGFVVFKHRYEDIGNAVSPLNENLRATVQDFPRKGGASFLTGYVEAPHEQVKRWLRSSGAAGQGPLMRVFRETDPAQSKLRRFAVSVPFYLAWFGPRTQHHTRLPVESLPPLPPWLMSTRGGTLGLRRFRDPWQLTTALGDGPQAVPGAARWEMVIQEAHTRPPEWVLELGCKLCW